MALFPLLALVFGAAYLFGRASAAAQPAHVGAPLHALPPAPRYVPHNEPVRASHLEPRRDVRDEHHGRERDWWHRPRPVIDVEMAPACPPSPMAVMSELIAQGQPVPPFVVQCAIAEAELAGQYEVAYRLQQQYVIPALASQQEDQSGNGDGNGNGDVPAPAPTAPPVQDDAMADALAASQPQGADGPAPDADSPIQGVPRPAWCAMLGALAREPVAFETPKHVGRYRQQKARAAEIGFDPTMLSGDPQMQDMALSHDLADCYRHLQASGTLDHYVGRQISVPTLSGQPATMKLSLSGLLGVCSVAGLERAIDWCENEDDRVRFPHTTMAALRTNGAF